MKKEINYSKYSNRDKKHDNKNGPCKCGSWHNSTDFDRIFDEVESDRKDGVIKSKVVKDKIWYKESQKNQGMFFRITSEGEKTLGQFSDGHFIPEKAIKNTKKR